MSIFTPAAFKTLQSDTEAVVRVDSLVSPRGKRELLRLLGMAEESVKIVECFLSHGIFEDVKVIELLERLASKGCDVRICFRKSEGDTGLEVADMVDMLKKENPGLVGLKLKCDRIRLFVNKNVIQKHFYIVDGRHVCVEFSRGRDPYGPATFFYDDAEYARTWEDIFKEHERERIEIKGTDLGDSPGN